MNNNTYSTPLPEQPNTLVWGILSLVFETILGIIFGAIGLKKGKQFIAEGGTLTGASKVGYILSRVGLILGIISTVIVVISWIILVGLVGADLGVAFDSYFSLT
ncbi:MAG: hypothetical protein ILO42_09355 [Clostridia bacterium]|nr:hypothetical protein [Clostridia bacterium]